MDHLAKQQACQLFIEQEIEKGLNEGKTKYAIGHEIAAWIKKLFEADVKPHTIQMRAERMEDKLVTNVTTDSTPQDQTEIKEIQDEPQHGGAREGAGRPTKFADVGQVPPAEAPEPEPEENPEEEVDDGRTIKHDSENLWRLKDTWKRSTKTDRKTFLRWIKREGSKL